LDLTFLFIINKTDWIIIFFFSGDILNYRTWF